MCKEKSCEGSGGSGGPKLARPIIFSPVLLNDFSAATEAGDVSNSARLFPLFPHNIDFGTLASACMPDCALQTSLTSLSRLLQGSSSSCGGGAGGPENRSCKSTVLVVVVCYGFH